MSVLDLLGNATLSSKLGVFNLDKVARNCIHNHA